MMITAYGDKENYDTAMKLGADDFLTKPLDLNELWTRLRVAERILRYTRQVRQLEELMPICKARCCKLSFALSTEDLDEGVIRWDYGQPYRIRQRASDGYCVHNDPRSGGCTVHQHRPAICRRYDCRNDTRIWTDYEARIPAPDNHPGDGTEGYFDLMDRAKLRALGHVREHNAIGQTFPDDEPREGPAVTPRPPRRSR